MKLSLQVLRPGKVRGKLISIRTTTPFLIGRSQRCHLRPNIAAISQRHCALVVRSDRAFVHDFGSTNGTFINGRQIQGHIELLPGDKLRIGPLEFLVCIEASGPQTMAVDEESVAAALLAMEQPDGPAPDSPRLDWLGIPTGSTITEAVICPTPAGE